MTPEPPAEKSAYPAPEPDWLKNGETPTPEQEREEVLRLARIIEKDRAEKAAEPAAPIDLAQAARVPTPEEAEILRLGREIQKERASAESSR